MVIPDPRFNVGGWGFSPRISDLWPHLGHMFCGAMDSRVSILGPQKVGLGEFNFLTACWELKFPGDAQHAGAS